MSRNPKTIKVLLVSLIQSFNALFNLPEFNYNMRLFQELRVVYYFTCTT